MSNHYVQYHQHKPGNEIKSGPGAFQVRATKCPETQKGDTIWLLSERKKFPSSCVLLHYFKAQDSAQPEGSHWVIRGTEGQMLGTKIENAPWVEDFFKWWGNEAFGIKKIDEKYLADFLPFMSEASVEDLLSDAIEEAKKTEHHDDVTILKTIKTRRGQVIFRKSLLDAYESRCCFTGCKVVDILEAAHISSHSEETNYKISNGLLLRADIHTLFDLNLIAVDKWNKIRLSKGIKDSEYQKLDSQMIFLPNKVGDYPSQYHLASRLEKLNLRDEGKAK